MQAVKNIESDGYRLSILHACLHNGTHADAPAHFLPQGEMMDALPLSRFMGACRVIRTGNAVLRVQDIQPTWREKIWLFDGYLHPDTAQWLCANGVETFGTGQNSVAMPQDTATVHRKLAEKNIVILENLALEAVAAGVYTLIALPIKIAHAEAAFVRAVLLESASSEGGSETK